jgi:hypothetical protein
VSPHEAITIALDAIEDGDVRAAVDVLLDGLEGEAPASLPCRCSCGRRFRWPGELEGHLFRYGHEPAEDA